MITNLKKFIAALINNHFRLMIFIVIIGCILYQIACDQFSFSKLASVGYNLAIYFAVSLIFNKFYLKYDEDTDKVIFSNPIALAIYLGLNAIAVAVICIH